MRLSACVCLFVFDQQVGYLIRTLCWYARAYVPAQLWNAYDCVHDIAPPSPMCVCVWWAMANGFRWTPKGKLAGETCWGSEPGSNQVAHKSFNSNSTTTVARLATLRQETQQNPSQWRHFIMLLHSVSNYVNDNPSFCRSVNAFSFYCVWKRRPPPIW